MAADATKVAAEFDPAARRTHQTGGRLKKAALAAQLDRTVPE